MCVYIYVHAHTHTRAHTHICICICIYMYGAHAEWLVSPIRAPTQAGLGLLG